MRHRKKSKRLGRQNSHRKATVKNMARTVLINESIRTTKVKAKVAQSLVDKLITIAKTDSPESKRHIFSIIRDKNIIETLFNDIAPRFKSRNGGYTRLIPLYPRKGDGSPMAILELVEKKPKVETQKPKKGAKQPKPADNQEAPDAPAKREAKEPKAPKTGQKTAEKPAPRPKQEKQPPKGKGQKGNLFKNFKRYFGNKGE
jgi:large subunit ribosomal protein L17